MVIGDKHNSASPPLYTNERKSNRKNGAVKPLDGREISKIGGSLQNSEG
jgi:hypothetical protein